MVGYRESTLRFKNEILAEIADFNIPHLYLAFNGPLKFAEIFGTRKLESVRYRMTLFA